MPLFSRRAPLPRVRRVAPARTIERGLGAIALFAAVLLLAGAVVVRHIANDTIEASHDAARSYQLKLELETLSTSLAQGEAGARAYIMSGRSSSLEPYQIGRVESGLSLAALRALTSSLQFQSTDVAQLDALVRQRFETLAKANAAREDSGQDSARQQIDNEAQRELSSHITALISVMQDREQRSLEASLARQSTSNDLALTAMVSTVLLLAVIAFAFWGTLKREFILRRRLEQRLSDTVVEDELTGAINRAAFERLLDEEWAFRLRYATPLSMLLVEIDNMGAVNAQFGLDNGDLLLRDVSRRLRARLRTTERLARYGGQQFSLLVPQSLNDAARLARQLAELLMSAPYPVISSSGETQGVIEVELSIGVADASDVESAMQLVLAAGEALYSAKQNDEAVKVEIYQHGMREAAREAEVTKLAPRKSRGS
jgi:diguanylate cyclase (GGDEF)-like protein